MTSSPTKSFAESYQPRVSSCGAGKVILFEQTYNEQERLAHFSEKQGFFWMQILGEGFRGNTEIKFSLRLFASSRRRLCFCLLWFRLVSYVRIVSPVGLQDQMKLFIWKWLLSCLRFLRRLPSPCQLFPPKYSKNSRYAALILFMTLAHPFAVIFPLTWQKRLATFLASSQDTWLAQHSIFKSCCTRQHDLSKNILP